MSSRSSSLLLPFETLVNRCIAQDQKLAAGVSRHSGRILQLHITIPVLDIFIHFYPASVLLRFDSPQPEDDTRPEAQGHSFTGSDLPGGAAGTSADSSDATAGDAWPRQVDARISASSLTLLKLLADRGERRSLVNPALQISGDVEFVQSVYRLFSAMQIDWQEPLSRVIGDVPTHGLHQLLDGLKSFSRQTTDSVTRSLDEYLHEESRLVPPRNQVEAFDLALDDLRLRLDRLQARVQLLADRINHPGQT